jgi:hypothetical protein
MHIDEDRVPASRHPATPAVPAHHPTPECRRKGLFRTAEARAHLGVSRFAHVDASRFRFPHVGVRRFPHMPHVLAVATWSAFSAPARLSNPPGPRKPTLAPRAEQHSTRRRPPFRPTPSVLALPQRLGRRGGGRRWAAGDVSIESVAPLPSTAPPAPLQSPQRTRGVARNDPSRLPARRKGVARHNPGLPVCRRRAARHDPPDSAYRGRVLWRGAAPPRHDPPQLRASPSPPLSRRSRHDSSRCPSPPLSVASPAAAKPTPGGARARRPTPDHAGRASRAHYGGISV